MREGIMRLPGGGVFVYGDAVLGVMSALEIVSAKHRANGMPRSGLLADLYDVFAAAAAEVRTSGSGSAEVPPAAEVSSSGMADPITASEAGRLTGTTPRNWRDLADRGALDTARKVGGRWLIERHEVLARRERRAS